MQNAFQGRSELIVFSKAFLHDECVTAF